MRLVLAGCLVCIAIGACARSGEIGQERTSGDSVTVEHARVVSVDAVDQLSNTPPFTNAAAEPEPEAQPTVRMEPTGISPIEPFYQEDDLDHPQRPLTPSDPRNKAKAPSVGTPRSATEVPSKDEEQRVPKPVRPTAPVETRDPLH